MLVEFRIRNFALVDDLTIGLGPGLNILTGETGSGKSVIVTALSVLLGAQPSGPLVRAGCDQARLDAVFHASDPEIDRLLREAGIEPEEDGSLSLAREFSSSKRTTARINNAAAALSLLRNISERLLDIHGQYAHQTLLRSGDHAQFLDASGGPAHARLLSAASDSFQKLRKTRSRLDELRRDSDRLAREAELLRFRIDEIDSLITHPEVHDELKKEIGALEHGRELAEAVHEAYGFVSRGGSDSSALNRLAAALNALQGVKGLADTLDEAITQFEDADAILDTACRSLGGLRDKFVYDPAKLEDMREKEYQIRDLLKKAGCATVEQLLEHRNKSEDRLEAVSLDEAGIEKLQAEERGLNLEAAEAARKLSAARGKLAVDFSKKMLRELKELAMPGASFAAVLIPFDTGEKVGAGDGALVMRETGSEKVEFRISANAGEEPRPLSQIASGGEVSRIMLAFKSLLRAADSVPVVVFDEIDTGIGGETAHSIAKKMATLAGKIQVIAITHLPQIAAAADRHITASKASVAGRTVIRTSEVQGAERIREMTRMLGATGREESRELAKSLVRDASKFKSKK